MTIKILTYNYFYLLLFLLPMILNSCGTNQTNQTINIPPNQAQIVGQIINILPAKKHPNFDDLCSKYPCIATVKVKSANYGAGFSPLLIGSNIKVQFVFTLSPTTSKMFPNMKESFPGLKVGDTFIALVSFTESISTIAPSYQVYNYSLK